MDAANPFAISSALAPDPTFSNFNTSSVGQHVKNSLSRQQFGGTLGFPITKDKTFLFLSYEGLRSDAIDAVPLLTNSSIFNPTLGQQAIIGGLAAKGSTMVPCFSHFPAGPPTFLPASICAFGLSSILSVNPTPGLNPFVSPFQAASNAFIVNQFENNSGLFPFPTREHQGYARLDHRFNNNNTASLRYTVAHLDETDPDVQALTAISRGTSLLNWDSTLQGSWFRQFSPNTINEARLQWVVNEFNVTTNDPGGPSLDVQGYGFFGRGIFLPSYTRTRRYEFADNVSMVRGHHQWKFGFYELIRGNKTTSETFFPGRFEFLQLPGILLSACLQVPVACGLPANTPSAPISTLQSWSLGLPAFFEQGFGNPTYAYNRPFTALYVQDSWQLRHNFTLNYGLRYELDSQYGQLNTYTKDFAPRLSIAWDPFSDGKTVVRAGYGIFYSPIYAQIPAVVQTLGNIDNTRQIANSLVTINGLPQDPALNSAFLFQSLFAKGKILCGTPPAGANACITRADLTALGLTISNTGPLPPGTVLFTGQPDYRPPMAQQASLGIERQIGAGLSVSANYIYVHTTHLPWAVDLNLLPGAPVVTGPGANALPTNGLPFQNWGAPACEATPALCFADPTHTILQNNMYASIASAVYHGGILELKERLNNRLLLDLNYTYSKAIDDSTDFNSDYAAFNQVALNQERALSNFDQRHKFVAAAVVSSPWDHNWFLRGFQLSPIISYNSGHPFNLLAGADINGDNHFTNDRPPGAPRNSGLGPNFFTWDMRLSREVKVSEKASLQLIAEGFNIANRVNYTTVNNILGNDSPACPVTGVNSGAAFGPPFNVPGNNIGPSCSLGFTSAAPMREVQLGIRLTF
jgi:hypothetical protein